MCWINSDECGLCFYTSLVFSNHFLTKEDTNLLHGLKSNFINCNINEFNSGLKYLILSFLLASSSSFLKLSSFPSSNFFP
jgi:hypothetical protein